MKYENMDQYHVYNLVIILQNCKNGFDHIYNIEPVKVIGILYRIDQRISYGLDSIDIAPKCNTRVQKITSNPGEAFLLYELDN